MLYLVSGSILIIDLFVKALVSSFLQPAQSIPLINHWFNITYVQNYGSAFGFFLGQRSFLLIIGIVVSAAIIYLYHYSNNNDPLLNLGYGFVLGGSLGNMINRICLGYVIDYLDFRTFPVFNVADVAINIGVLFIIVDIFKKRA